MTVRFTCTHGGGSVTVTLGSRLRRRGVEQLPVCHDHLNAQQQETVVRAWATYSARDSLVTLILVEAPPTSDFMRALPDNASLASVCMPGTHDSCALYGFPISQCQQPSTPIAQQLLDGVRFLDVRLRVVGDELLMYHGPRPQRSSFPLLVRVIRDFLLAHPRETLIVCLKEESPPWDARFPALVRRALEPDLEKFWFLEERVPALGEVRGRALVMTRFDNDGSWAAMGIHPTTWPDSRPGGFEWDCDGTRVRTQDWYRISTLLSIPEKYACLTTHLAGAAPGEFTLSYASASDFPLAPPTWIAKGLGWPDWGMGVRGVNDRLARWLLDGMASRGSRAAAHCGLGRPKQGDIAEKCEDRSCSGSWGQSWPGMCVPLDFYRQSSAGSLAELIVALNFV